MMTMMWQRVGWLLLLLLLLLLGSWRARGRVKLQVGGGDERRSE